MSVVLAYKNFAANRNISHIGLGVAAMNTTKVLRSAGIRSDVWPILSAADLRARLQSLPAEHVIISAPWIPAAELQSLAGEFTDTHFAVNCHSNVGFLQADRNGVKLLRETIEVEMGTHNVHVAGNTRRFCEWVRSAFGLPCAYLPNLYYLDARPNPHRPFAGGTLRIGAFGATRPLKNLMSAAGAAVEIARNFRASLELWLSAGRAEGGGEGILAAVKEMLNGLPNVTLIMNGWQSWPKFRQTVGHMHLLLQPSYTESFNMVTADGVAEGIPSVVSKAIDWAPDDWKAEVDDVLDIARIGRRLLCDPRAAQEGWEALESYVASGLLAYQRYFARR
ncbi:MAG: glycosyltransferase [Acidobacteriaceae bacterium]|nr:glycosyltransferase [Acidobacteriaceae bacterium]MBV9503080.1 glycosyltransferase [Acidobacteriaceae bacterium]